MKAIAQHITNKQCQVAENSSISMLKRRSHHHSTLTTSNMKMPSIAVNENQFNTPWDLRIDTGLDIIPLIGYRGLNPTARWIYLSILALMRSGECDLTAKTLSQIHAITQRTLYNALHQLKEQNLAMTGPNSVIIPLEPDARNVDFQRTLIMLEQWKEQQK